ERQRVEKEKSESERKAAEKLALEKAEDARRAALKAEEERQKIEKEKSESERKLAEKLALEKAEEARRAALKAEEEQHEKEKTRQTELPAAKEKPVTIVEREKLKQILDEQKLSEALGDEGKKIELGKIKAGTETQPYKESVAVASVSRKPEASVPYEKSCVKNDKERPVLVLKDSGDIYPVFVDKYPVEGEVFANCIVDKLVINNKEVPLKKGQRIYFSKIVKLNTGENKIAVEVYDTVGNKSAATFTVTRKTPSTLQEGNRMSMLVLPFDVMTGMPTSATIAENYLAGSFTEQSRFHVVERQKLKDIMEAQKFSQAVFPDLEQFIKIGKLMTADTLLATTIKENIDSIEVASRVINIETSEIMAVRDVYTEDKSPSAVKEIMESLAAKIAESFPLVEGIVITQKQGEVVSDLGKTSKIRKRMGVIVYRKGTEIKHPKTGKSLGWDTITLGDGYIEDVEDEFSKIRLSGKSSTQDITVNDMVITK
ncbi:MAG: hypothetical protein HQL08_13335, partial [Nitrospirae bacterium]|nr:hypothetical protein [Nitrospirota bacterium]